LISARAVGGDPIDQPADMSRSKLEVADIFRLHGKAWRAANAGHVNLTQRRVMTAIESCRTAALGGHIERCEDCRGTRIAYNSCRNRHCPKCQWRSAQAWLSARKAELLPVPYFHLVFKLPNALGAVAYQNKIKLYGLLLRVAAETLIRMAADCERLGAQVGVTTILHTWGQNLQHHPHVHCLLPAGGLSLDGMRWIKWKTASVRPRQLSEVFRRLFLQGLAAAFEARELQFFGELVDLNDPNKFAAALAILRTNEWMVYAKKPFANPKEVLAYLARYTHRVAIANTRLVELDESHVSFRCDRYRANGRRETKVMRLEIPEFVRRFLLHVMPDGFQRIRHYGLFANNCRAKKVTLCRKLLESSDSRDGNQNGQKSKAAVLTEHDSPPCPCCGGRMRIVGRFEGILSRPHHVRRLDGL
jgi:Putative transposase/Transposase zinc-binding domain